ncbi:MAG: hypothetical protein KDD56_01445 [Bdellovibrionales bacterium]|nr:hypothetical protein [Bdellovibrionales bacterium]
MSVSNVNNNSSSTFEYIVPEPESSISNTFGDVLRSAASVASTATGIGGVGAEIYTLLDQQIEVQREMQTITMLSNIERSKHEMKMGPIRNMRISS